MNDTVTTVLRVAFLVILIWALAELVGLAPGASLRAGGFRAQIGARGNCRGHRGRRPRWEWGSNGMAGELIPTTGAQPTLAGMQDF